MIASRLLAAPRVLVLAGVLVVGATAGILLTVNGLRGGGGPSATPATSPSPVPSTSSPSMSSPSASSTVTASPGVPPEEPVNVIIASDTINPTLLRPYAYLCMLVNESRISCSGMSQRGKTWDAEDVIRQIPGLEEFGLLFWGCDEQSPSSECHVTVDGPRTVAVTSELPVDKKYVEEFDGLYQDGRLDSLAAL